MSQVALILTGEEDDEISYEDALAAIQAWREKKSRSKKSKTRR
jgi:hypothetical protein